VLLNKLLRIFHTRHELRLVGYRKVNFQHKSIFLEHFDYQDDAPHDDQLGDLFYLLGLYVVTYAGVIYVVEETYAVENDAGENDDELVTLCPFSEIVLFLGNGNVFYVWVSGMAIEICFVCWKLVKAISLGESLEEEKVVGTVDPRLG